MKYFAMLEDVIVTEYNVIARECHHAIVSVDSDALRTQDIRKYNPIEIKPELLIGVDSLRTQFPFHKVYVNNNSTFEEETVEKVKKVVYFTEEELNAGFELFKLLTGNYIDNLYNNIYESNTPKIIDKATWDIQKDELVIYKNDKSQQTPFVDSLALVSGLSRDVYFKKIEDKITKHNDYLLSIITKRRKVLTDLKNIKTKLDQSLFMTKWLQYPPNYKLFDLLNYKFDKDNFEIKTLI